MTLSRRAIWAMALLLTYPGAASPSSLARCRARDLSGLSAPWAGKRYSQPDDATLWSIESGLLRRQPAADIGPVGLGDEYLHTVYFVTPEVGWVLGEDGTIANTRDGGRHWTRPSLPFEGDLEAISCVDEQQCWLLGDSGILHTRDGGKTWKRHAKLRLTGTDIFFLNPRSGWIADGDAYWETRDGGTRWQRMASPDPVNRTPVPGCEAIRFIDPERGWIVSGDRLLVTRDGGQTWTVSLQLPAGFEPFVVSHNGQRVYVAVEGDCDLFSREGVNYSSDDEGRTWTRDLPPQDTGEDMSLLDDHAELPLRRLIAPLVFDSRGDSWNAEIAEVYAEGDAVGSQRSRITRRTPCGDVEIEATHARLNTSLATWTGERNPCLLDPERVNAIIARFPADGIETKLVAECGGATKVFRFDNWIHRPRIGRAYPSIVALLELVDQVQEAAPRLAGTPETRRQAGMDIASQLAAGLYDAAFDQPGNVRALLKHYEGPLPPKGCRGRLEVDLPEGVRLDSYVEPSYPEIALLARVTGEITLDLTVESRTGVVSHVRPVKPFPLLQDAAIHAAAKWRFVPDSRPAESPVRVTIRFSIDRCVRGGVPDP